MIHRNLNLPHRFVVVTDQPGARFDPLVEPVPLWDDWRRLTRSHDWGDDRPSCYVRLKAFSADAGLILGERFVSIDLDCVVCSTLDPLFERDEDFLIIRRTALNPTEARTTYQGSMWLMSAGARRRVWEDFHGEKSVRQTLDYLGTDQAWISYKLGPNEKGWNETDGVYCFRNLQEAHRYDLPDNARIVFFNTREKPWEHRQRRAIAMSCRRCGAADAIVLNRCSKCGARTAVPRQHEWIAEYYQ